MNRILDLVESLAAAVARLVPFAPFHDALFLQRALLGLFLLAPLCSMIGMQVVNYRLAFFSEAVGHSAFTGVAVGLLLGVLLDVPAMTGHEMPVTLVMAAFGMLVAAAITAYRRSTTLSSDTILGVFSAFVIAAGLCIIDVLIRQGWLHGQSIYQSFLMGSILTITKEQLAVLMGLFLVVVGVQVFAYNRLMFLGINAELACTRGIRVPMYEYLFAAMLALVVMFSIQVVGVLLVTALLVIPGATARNLSRTAGGSWWISLAAAMVACIAGLVVSVVLDTPTGATVILCMTALFLATTPVPAFRGALDARLP